jgi:hypothetical protein
VTLGARRLLLQVDSHLPIMASPAGLPLLHVFHLPRLFMRTGSPLRLLPPVHLADLQY